MSGPSSSASQRLVIKSTAGASAPETTNQAVTLAATAVAAGVEGRPWGARGAARRAVPGRAGDIALEHAASMAELVEAVLEGGTLTVCTQCAVRRGLTQEDLLPGVRIAGAPKFVEEIMTPGTQALVY